MPILDNCCRCCTLRTGTIVSGILGILIGIATIILVLLTKVKMHTILIDDLDPLYVKIILVINLVMTILISVFLVVGAIRRNRWFMLPWVVLAIIIAIGLVISVIYTSIRLFIDKQNTAGALLLVFGLVGSAIFIYLWFVVFSFFQLVRQEKARGPYGRPPYQYNT